MEMPMLSPPKYVRDLYRRRHVQEFEMGNQAATFCRRVADCLDAEGVKVDSAYQWRKEISPNHHPKALTPVFPITLIKSREDATVARYILKRESDIKNLQILLAANSSGGFNPDTKSEYLFQTRFREDTCRDFQKAEEAIEREHKKNELFRQTGTSPIDYIVLQGDDTVSKSKLFIEIGEIPIERKKSRFVHRSFGLVPARAAQIFPYEA